MEPEYVSDLNQTNMLRELNKKLPCIVSEDQRDGMRRKDYLVGIEAKL